MHGNKGLEFVREYASERFLKHSQTDGKPVYDYPEEMQKLPVGATKRLKGCQSYTEMEPKLNKKNEELQHHGYEPVGREEFVAARLYTGPMYVKYNVVLRGLNDAPGGKQAEEFQDVCCGNNYTTTLHLINSAVVKLSKLTAVGKPVC